MCNYLLILWWSYFLKKLKQTHSTSAAFVKEPNKNGKTTDGPAPRVDSQKGYKFHIASAAKNVAVQFTRRY